MKTIADARAAGFFLFGREIQALSRVHHPGIVKVHAHGTHEGRPWYAMELLPGRTLADVIAGTRPDSSGPLPTTSADLATLTGETAATTVPEPPPGAPQAHPPSPREDQPNRGRPMAAGGRLRDAVTLILRICEPLALAHSLGITHRDLKPGNVLLRSDDDPVLVDFGIAAHSGGAPGREVVELDGWTWGTVAYVAPEQARGEHADTRADIYALGCITYELLVGSPPFGRGSRATLLAHQYEPPRAPSASVDGVPPELDRLVLGMLEKSPARRISYIEDVARVLEQLGAEGRPGASAPPRMHLHRPRFVGRESALERFGDELRATQTTGGRILLVSGKSGTGKTRFATEAGRQALREDVRVVVGECLDVGTRLPGEGVIRGGALHPLRSFLMAVADRCRELGPAETTRLLGPHGPVLAPYVPTLSDIPKAEAWVPPHRLPAAATQLRVFRAILHALTAFANNAPLLLVLDDLQWADELTLGFLRYAARTGFQRTPALILGTYREEEQTAELTELTATCQTEPIELGPLDEELVGNLVGGTLGQETPSRSFVRFVAQRSSGNAFFVMEYLRAALSRGTLQRSEDGGWSVAAPSSGTGVLAPGLPTSIDDLIELRLTGLTDTSRTFFEFAAAMGRDFHAGVVASAAGIDRSQAIDAVNDLVATQVIEPLELDRYRFLHDKLREIPYRNLATDRRRQLHECLAEAIEAEFEAERDLEHYRAALGRHWSLSGRPDRAAPHLFQAGKNALEVYANKQSLELLRAASDEVEAAHWGWPQHPERDLAARIGEALGDVLARLGRYDEARNAYADAEQRAAEGDAASRARVHRKIGKTFETAHRHEDALSAYTTAESVLDSSEELDDRCRTEWLHIKIERIWTHYWLAQVGPILELLEEVSPWVDAHATPLQRSRYLGVRLLLAHRQERYSPSDATLSVAADALEAARSANELGLIAFSRFAAGFTELAAGLAERAASSLSRALEQAEHIGDAVLAARCLSYLATARRMANDEHGADSLARRSLARAEQAGIQEYIGTAHANLAWVALRRGDRPGAREHALAARTAWAAMPVPYPFQWTALLPLIAMMFDDASDREETVAAATSLLPPPLQLLAPGTFGALERARDAHAAGDAPGTHEALATAVAAAHRDGYL